MSHRSHVGKVMARLIALLAVLLIVAPAFTQAPGEDVPEDVETKATPDPEQESSPISVSAKIDQSQLKPGQTAKLLITAKLEPRWHLYALTQQPPPRPAKVTIDESGAFKMNGAVQQPKPKVYKDPNFSEPGKPPFMSQAFENEVTFTAPVKVKPDAKPGPQKLIAKFSYQVCDDHQCLRPTTKTFELDVAITAGAVKTSSAVTSETGPAKQPATATSPSPTAAPTATAAPT